jgi:hypothetical protein
MYSFLGKYSIDSLKLFIPLEFCKITDNRLTDNYISVHEKSLVSFVNNEAGADEIEIDNTYFKAKAIPINENGIHTKFLIMKMFVNKAGEQKPHLIILLNSKTLKENYFHGISATTIKRVFQYLMSLKVFQISFDDFLEHSKCSDIDFKIDEIAKDYNTVLKTIVEKIETSKVYSKSYKGHKAYNQKYNKGITFGDRSQATANYPFYKIYVKCLELEKNRRKLEATKKGITQAEMEQAIKQDAFYNTYLKHYAEDTRFYYILRAEFTLKNKEAIKNFLGCDNTLKWILRCKQKAIESAIQKVWECHISKIKTVKGDNTLTPTDRIIFNQLQYINILQPNLPYIKILDIVLQNLSATERSRMKAKFENIYFMHFSQEEKEKKIKEQKITKKLLHKFGYIS